MLQKNKTKQNKKTKTKKTLSKLQCKMTLKLLLNCVTIEFHKFDAL